MINLVVDVGNTNTKLFLFEEGKLIFKHFESNEHKHFNSRIIHLLKNSKIDNCIVSSVSKINNEKYIFFKENFNTFFFNREMKVPVEIGYRTPETLGYDRIANVSGASVLFPGKDVLVIDSGTAITYDIIEAGIRYLGGNISPGILTRFKSLHTFTEKLPLLNISFNTVGLYGDSTESAIILGVQNGITYEVMSTINAFKGVYKDLVVVFTGGDVFFFEKSLKICIFVEPNLTAIGLNKILEINV